MIYFLKNFILILGWTTNELGLDALKIIISSENKQCSNHAIIQIAKTLNNQNKDIIWELGEINRNIIKTSNNFYIDHQSCLDHNCSMLYKDSWKIGSNFGNNIKPTTIEDYPFGWDKMQEINLESCNYCLDNNQFYGCIQFGAIYPVLGLKTIITPTYSDFPSQDFKESVNNFNNFYKKH